jgi:hypothetical protein
MSLVSGIAQSLAILTLMGDLFFGPKFEEEHRTLHLHTGSGVSGIFLDQSRVYLCLILLNDLGFQV